MASSTRQDTEEEARPSSSMHAKVLHTLPRWLGCCEVRFNNRQQVVSYTIHTTARFGAIITRSDLYSRDRIGRTSLFSIYGSIYGTMQPAVVEPTVIPNRGHKCYLRFRIVDLEPPM
jgi:hypothetical protein